MAGYLMQINKLVGAATSEAVISKKTAVNYVNGLLAHVHQMVTEGKSLEEIQQITKDAMNADTTQHGRKL